MKKISTCLIAAGLIMSTAVNAARDADKVASLPDCAALPSNWYSGYINATQTKLLHFVLIESLDQPSTDPLLIWFNGGPGCSSMLGLFSEHGPFIFDDGESFIKPNPEPWNKRANVLYIESPAGVGFSYAGGENDTLHTDVTQSQDLMNAIRDFYVGYPEYLDNDLYITGESYAGVYAPYLAWQIHQWNQKAKLDKTGQTPIYPLKGFIVGNGVTNYHLDCEASLTQTMANFNLIPYQTYEKYVTLGCKYYWVDFWNTTNSQECQDLWAQVQDTVSDLNEYDLFRKVYPDSLSLASQAPYGEVEIDGEVRKYKRGMNLRDYTPWMKKLLGDKSNHPLLGAGLSDYLNRPDVRTALHILPNISVFEQCSSTITYNQFREGSQWIYAVLKAYDYRLMHYSGDTDGAVPTVGTHKWIQTFNWTVSQDWQQWHTDGEFSGNIIQYDNFAFATIHGVGHMAPQWKRKDVTNLISKYVHNELIN